MVTVAPATDGRVDFKELSAARAGRDWTLRSVSHLWLAAEADMIVEIDQLEPCLYVFAIVGEFADVLGEVLKGLDVAARTSAHHECAPGIDLPGRAFLFRVGVDPFQDFAVPFARGKLLLQSGEIETRKILQMLIDRRGEGECPLRP